jgi:gliding motility-associated-like protein
LETINRLDIFTISMPVTRENKTPIKVCQLIIGLLMCLLTQAQTGMQNIIRPIPNTPSLPGAATAPRLQLSSASSLEKHDQSMAACQNTAFFLHLPAPGGQQIRLTDLHTLPGGDYLAAASLTNPSGELSGQLLRIDNSGTIIFQQTLTIDNQSCSVNDIFVTSDGLVYAMGIIQNGSRKIFIAQLNINLAVNWVKSIELPGQPVRVAITPTEDSAVAWAAQSSDDLHYGIFSQSGISRWMRQSSPVNMVELSGIAKMNNSSIALAYHTQQAGLQSTRFLEIRETDGTALWDFGSGNSAEENITQKTSYFNNRIRRLEIKQLSTGAVVLKRYIQFNANSNETEHSFVIPGLSDFTATASMDPSGDIMGLCLPATGRLFLFKQFTDYLTSVEIAREFQVPAGSSLVTIARSFDGGFLLGVNSQASNEILLVKTDSSGQLPTCGFTNPTIRSSELLGTQNQAQTTTGQTISLNTVASSVAMNSISLTGRFDCFNYTCRPAPAEDSCLSSYYRIFRSNSYAELVYNYALMRNNRHLLSTNRYDRVLGITNSRTSALKLMDDRGTMLKAVNFKKNNSLLEFQTHQLDDHSIMLINNSSTPNAPSYDITLVTDNLDIAWSRTIRFQNEFYSTGMGFGDVKKDQQGNYYLAGTTFGFMERPKCTIVKLDPSGNLVWNKTYEWADGLFGVVSITCTDNAVVAIIETSNINKTTLRLHKDDGRFLNSYQFKYGTSNSANFYLYKHLLSYSEGRILYAGHGENDYFLMGILDTTGKPMSFKTIQHPGSVMRAGTVNNGNIYATYYYFDGSRYREFLFKTDGNLNLSFFRQIERNSGRLHNGLQVTSTGSIYASGYNYYQNYNFDSYLMKFDAEGVLGTCTMQDIIPPIVDISFNPVAVTPVLVNKTFPLEPNQISVEEDPNDLVLAEILCSSISNCSTLKISGPEAVCEPDTDISYRFTTNPGCTLKPGWIYDTAYVQLRQLTDTNAIFRFRKAGSTLLKASLNAGCNQYRDSLRIIIQDARIRLSLGADTAFCPGDSIRLSAGPGYPGYRWQDGSTDSVFVVKQPGTYHVSVTNGCGLPYADTIAVERRTVPLLFIGNDTTICPGNIMTFRAAPGFSSYNWATSDGTLFTGQEINVRVQNNLDMRILARTANGCVSADSANLRVFTVPNLNLGPDLSFCDYDSALLNAGNNFSSYLWNNGNTGNTIRVKNAGLYWVKGIDMNGCAATDTVSISVNTAPAFSFGQDRNLCEGENLILDPGPYAQFTWQDASSNRTLTVRQAGIYWVSVTDTRGCRGSDSLRINSILPVPANFLAPSVTFCKYQRVDLSPQGTFNQYLWSTGARQRTISVDRGGRYTLEVIDANGCRGRDTIQVVENDCLTGIFLPNAFTPNGDRLNDQFRALVYGKVISFSLQVYNRFGEMVFSTSDPGQGWDGFYKGKSSPSGNFVWQCRYHLEGSEPGYQKGTVMLIR